MSQTVGYSLGTRGIFISDLLPMQKGGYWVVVCRGATCFCWCLGWWRQRGCTGLGWYQSGGCSHIHDRAVELRSPKENIGQCRQTEFYPVLFISVHYRVGMTAKGSAEKDFSVEHNLTEHLLWSLFGSRWSIVCTLWLCASRVTWTIRNLEDSGDNGCLKIT